MATQQYFALDSLATGYADAIAKLATDTSTNRGYTVTQVVRSASHDSDIKIVCAYVDESDLTGDTANLAEGVHPNALCVARFIDLDEFRDFGFYLLGEAARGWNTKLTGGNVYIRHGLNGDSGGDGKTAQTAMTWYAAEPVTPNCQYVRVGRVFFQQHTTINVGGQAQLAFTDGSAGDEIVIRDDYSSMPGVATEGWNLRVDSHPTYGTVGSQAWVQDGTEPEVWSQSDYSGAAAGQAFGHQLVFGGDFPILGTSTEWHDDWVLQSVASLALCRTTVSSCFHDADGTTLHVHLHDGASPSAAGRTVLRPGSGWRFEPRQAVSKLAAKVRFINTQTFGYSASQLMRCTSTTYNCDSIVFEGGRWIWTTGDWFIRGACAERKWTKSTTGRILWDTSDRPDTPTSEGILELLTPNETWDTNMAAGSWDDWKRHVEIGWCTVGPHPSSTAGISGTTPIEDGFPPSFVNEHYYYHHFEDTKGISRDNADRHPIAIRGNFTTDPIVRKGYCFRVPNGCYFYVPSSAGNGAPAIGSANNCHDYLIEDVVIDTWPDVIPSAGVFGIQVGGDNDTILMDNGTGLRNGTARRIVVIDMKPTGSVLGSPSQEQEGHAFGVPVVDCTVIRSNWGWRNDRAGHVQAFSSVQTVSSDVVDDDLTTTIVEDTNTPATLALTTTYALAVGRQQGKFRRIEIRLTQNGAGTAVIAWQYWNGAWTAIPGTGFTDGTSGFTQSGTVTFTKPADWVANMIGTRECFHVRAIVASGSFTTSPIMDQCRGPQTGSTSSGRRIRFLEPEQGVFWARANQFGTSTGGADIDDITIRPKSTQDPDTFEFFRIGNNSLTVAEFQAQTKSAADTDADADSVFAPTITFLEALP